MANKLFHGDPGDGLPSPWDVIQVNSFSPPVAQPHPQIPNLGKGHVFTLGGVPIPTGGGTTTQGGGGASGATSLGRVTAANGLVTAIANANFSTITAATYSILATDDALWFDATSAGITATLPLASSSTTQRFLFVGKKDSSANTVTFSVSGSDTVLGSSSLVLAGQYDAVILVSDGVSAWVDYARMWGKQTANTVFASPNGSSGLPGFRALVSADLPGGGAGAAVYLGTASFVATSAIALTGTPTVDGQGTAAGSIILAVNQGGSGSPPYAADINNGLWMVVGIGQPFVRAAFYPTGLSISYGRLVFVDQGTLNAGLQTTWEMTTGGAPVVDTNAIAWTQVSISLQASVVGKLPVANGGTGDTTLTAHGLLTGQGTAAVVAMAAGSAGQIVQSGGASADPVYSTATYPATAGTSGNILASNGTNVVSQALATSQIPDTTNYRYITFVFGNGGSVLTTGLVNACAALNGGATLIAVYLMSADSTSGSATVDILRANAAVPTSSNSIVGGGGTKPALSSATYVKDTTFTSWTSTTFAADDVISLNLTAVTSLKYLSVTLVIKVT